MTGPAHPDETFYKKTQKSSKNLLDILNRVGYIIVLWLPSRGKDYFGRLVFQLLRTLYTPGGAGGGSSGVFYANNVLR